MWAGTNMQPGVNMASDRAVKNQPSMIPRFIRISKIAILVGTLVASGGCRVGPNHGPPPAPLTNQWKVPQESVSAACMADPCAAWWSDFQDPDLDHLMQWAVAANPGLREAYFRIMESRARRGVVTGQRLPEVKGDGRYSYKKVSGNSSPYALTAQESFSLFSTSFDASWEMDLWGKYCRAIEAADAEICVSQGDYHYVLLTLLGDVAVAYVELRTYQERIEVANQNLEVQQRTLRFVQERNRVGLTKPLDSAQAKSNLHATMATIPALEIGLQQAENRLCVLLGEAPHDLRAQLDPVRPIPVAPAEVALGFPADLLRRRPDLKSAEAKVAAASARIGVAVADLYPQLSLTGTISVDSADITNLFTSQSVAHHVGPALTWNILNFGRIRNKIRAQEARFEQAVQRYQSTVLSAAEEVENALASYMLERERSESLAQAVAAAKESNRLAELYYGQGLTNFQSVLDAQRSMLVLQDKLALNRAAVTHGRISLYKALGGGWSAAASRVQTDQIGPQSVDPEVIPLPEVNQQVPGNDDVNDDEEEEEEAHGPEILPPEELDDQAAEDLERLPST
jgi:NodT family efflux transporter outer membrane factor (OMF) lipoprotein